MSPTTEEPPRGDPTPPPRKRRKTQLACHPCRARKTGCDGQRPYCNSCITRGWESRCGYPELTIQSSSPLTLGNLEKRLRKLEENSKRDGSSGASIPQQTSERVGSSAVSQTRPASDWIETVVSDRVIPVVNAPASIQSSNSAFVEQVASVVGSGYDHIDKTGTGIRVSKFTPDYNTKDIILPTREFADKYLHCYWEFFHPIFPILHRPKFHTIYSQLWQPATASQPKLDDAVFYSILNMVLALGCQRNESLGVSERDDLANEFYRRSVKLLSLDTLDASSLQIVQLLVLRGFYLLYSPLADRCWIVTGAAVRVAQVIGLQSVKTEAALNQFDREMRRRVWHNCVILDWMASISFDRPAALSNTSKVPLPECIDDEYLSEGTNEGSQPLNIPSCLTYFIYSIRLLDVRRTVEDQHETQGKKPNDGYELGATLDIISELDRFLEALPPHLQTDYPSALSGKREESCFELQARVLKARVMYSRLRLLRPFVLSEARRSINTPETNSQVQNSKLSSQDRLRQELCVLCIATAHEALDELHRRLESVHRSSPWHTLYCKYAVAFASASVLIAATLCPSLNVQFHQDPFKQSWEKTLRIFAFHKSHVASAEKGLRTLERLRNHVKSRRMNASSESSTLHPKDGNDSSSAAGGKGIGGGVKARPVVTAIHGPSAAVSNTLSEPQTFPEPEISEFIDFAPMDESWLLSQEFSFVDDMAQWELYPTLSDPIL